MVLRCVVTTAALLLSYSIAPFETSDVSYVGVRLAISLVLFIGIIVWQFRAILRSAHPRFRAVEALLISGVMLVIIFASTYVALGAATPEAFSEPVNHSDGIYFTVTVLSTVGFGDITPVSTPARMITTVQMLVDLAFIGVLVRLLLRAARQGAARRVGGAATATGDNGSTGAA